MLNMSS